MTKANPEPATFAPVKIAGKSWWVPKVYSAALAVPLEDPARYREAIFAKMVHLIKRDGLEETRERVADVLAGDLIQIDLYLNPELDSPELLAREILEKSPATSMKIWDGDPSVSEPASLEDAQDAVQGQEELDLVDLLG